MSEIDTKLTIGELADIFGKALSLTLKDTQGICVIYKGETIVVYRNGEDLNYMKIRSEKVSGMKEGDLIHIEVEDENEETITKN